MKFHYKQKLGAFTTLHNIYIYIKEKMNCKQEDECMKT